MNNKKYNNSVVSYPSTFISLFARNCTVRKIDSAPAKAFMEANHRYGFSKCRYCYGLFVSHEGHDGVFHMNDMVAVACFSNARRWVKGDRTVRSYEWVRYASVEGTRVLGGMSKLLKAFIADTDPDDIMSYAPLESGDEGEVYATLGFVREADKAFPGGTSAKFRLKLKNY